MPKMVHIAANPAFKPENSMQKADFDALKKKGTMEVSYVTAMENIRNSGGMIALKVADAALPQAQGIKALEDMDLVELKQMMLIAGVVPQKQMKKTEVIAAIRKKLDAVEVVEDEDAEA